MSRLPLTPFWKPQLKTNKESIIVGIKVCAECHHWKRWKTQCQLGYNTKANTRVCRQALPKRLGDTP